jgi:hypothetical protein
VLTIGALLVCVGLLTLTAVAPVFCSSKPPRWTTSRWVGELVTLAIVCMLALGFGYFGAGVIAAFQTRLDYLDLGQLAGVVFVSVVIWRWLRARSRTTALEAAASARVPGWGDAGSPMVTAEQAPLTAGAPQPPHRAA